jgi:1,2-dihydroxy-3-keto-5-methylthiopentene dioxygenase
MSYLREYSSINEFIDYSEFNTIQKRLAKNGVLLEKWEAGKDLNKNAEPKQILETYKASIEVLKIERGFVTEDLVAIDPSTENYQVMRKKFLQKHTHRDDEARYFGEGSGLFYIRKQNSTVQLLLCEKGELINLPAGTRHWFDMGSQPYFKAVRVFFDHDGWVGNFTSSGVDQNYPGFDKFIGSIKK